MLELKKWECIECHTMNTFNKYGCKGICVGCGRMGDEKLEAESQQTINKFKRLMRKKGGLTR